MDEALTVHRLHFAFTVTYHYLFPQLTMGLALLIFLLKTAAMRSGEEIYDRAAGFWGKIFGIAFAMGVVTGIPLEFQFGTNWSEFSRAAGGVIGQTLAMEGVFAFFLESSFLGIFLYGGRRIGPVLHWLSSLMLLVGTWLSGYFIIVADAWMQHPVGYRILEGGGIALESFWEFLLNPWALVQYAHNMSGSVVTAAFAMSAVGSYYLITGQFEPEARVFLRLGVVAGAAASAALLFPTGDLQGKMVAVHQPVTLAAMEGLFDTERGAPLAILGQPDMESHRLDNPLVIPRMLSFLTYRRWGAEVKGLNAWPEERWPDNVPLLYYSYHIMVGLGTIFVAVMAAAAWLLWKGRLFEAVWIRWLLMLAAPFPFIANTAGWITAELGRQPWVIYGLMRTSEGASPTVSAGNGLFTLIGFMGMYSVLSILFLFLVRREIEHGPAVET